MSKYTPLKKNIFPYVSSAEIPRIFITVYLWHISSGCRWDEEK